MELFSKRRETAGVVGLGLALALGATGTAACDGGRPEASSVSSAGPTPAEYSPSPAATPSPNKGGHETCKSRMPVGVHAEMPPGFDLPGIAARLGVTVQRVRDGELVSVACGKGFTPDQMTDYELVIVAGRTQECAIIGQDATQPGEEVTYEAACPA